MKACREEPVPVPSCSASLSRHCSLYSASAASVSALSHACSYHGRSGSRSSVTISCAADIGATPCSRFWISCSSAHVEPVWQKMHVLNLGIFDQIGDWPFQRKSHINAH